jgi:hypothetical protein
MSNLETTTETDLAPPDDFGASLLAEFQRREFGSGGAAMMSDATPPGEWPGGATVDAGEIAKRINAATVAGAATDATDPDPDPDATTTPPSDATTPDATTIPADTPPGEVAPPATASEDTPSTPASHAAGVETTDTSDATATDADANMAASASGGYVWQDGDNQHQFTDDQVQRALLLNAWAERLPEQTRVAFAAIEEGQAVAVSRADFDQFKSWREQQTRAQRDADLANLDVDPDVAKLVTSLRDEVAQLRGQASPVSRQDDPVVANVNANLDATAQRMDAGARAYAAERQLTEAELQSLFAAAVSAEIIPKLAEANAVTNPLTGAVIQPADPAVVIEQALDFALVRNPVLHTAVAQRRATAPTTPTPADAALTAKKARAASVASAPSTAVTPSPRTSKDLSPQERVDAMAADLAAVLGRS